MNEKKSTKKESRKKVSKETSVRSSGKSSELSTDECGCAVLEQPPEAPIEPTPFLDMLETMKKNGTLQFAKRITGDCEDSFALKCPPPERDIWPDILKCDTSVFDARVRTTYLNDVGENEA